MRTAAVLLLTLALGSDLGRAGEEEIPIEVEGSRRVRVPPEQLTWIRTWLREHLHVDDLAGVKVTIANRTHPLVDYRAIAFLKPAEVDTHLVGRTISFRHRSWRSAFSHREDAASGYQTVGEWVLKDAYEVKRIYPLGTGQKVLRLSDTLSYDATRAVLEAVNTEALDFDPKILAPELPPLPEITSILRLEDGRIQITTTDPDHGLTGRIYYGLLRDGRFAIDEIGGWIT